MVTVIAYDIAADRRCNEASTMLVDHKRADDPPVVGQRRGV
jgi:hypothetical protein